MAETERAPRVSLPSRTVDQRRLRSGARAAAEHSIPMRSRAAVLVLAFGVLAAAVPGPHLPEAIFVAPRGRDDPRAFGSGQIGIPLPTYYQRYLYLASRALSGQAPAGNDLDAALAVPASSYGEDQPWYTRWR